MAAPANTIRTTSLVGQREDLEDIIRRVAAEDRPFRANIGTTPVKARYHEWLTEALATPDATNTQLEGDDYAAAAGNAPTRVGTYCQISAKAFTVSRTTDLVDKAGRDTETARHKIIRGLELQRDLEARFIGNYASENESGATTRKTAGALAWVTTHDSRGASGADGGFGSGVVAAATNGTQREFTEALLQAVQVAMFANGARAKHAYMGGTQKQKFSRFTGIVQHTRESRGAQVSIIGAADEYVGDFGTLTAIPHPYALSRDVLLSDPAMWARGVLDSMKTQQLGKTGDANKWLITVEECMVCRNEMAHGVIADLL